jgi:universal stress protein F
MLASAARVGHAGPLQQGKATQGTAMATTILVPIDLSLERDRDPGFEQARAIARLAASRLVLLYVLPDVPLGYISPDQRASTLARLKYEAFERLKAVAETAVDMPVEVIVEEGAPARAILDVARALPAHLIVMASHNPAFSDYVLGSVAARVVRYAQCSVLVARQGPPED